jgi:hypothetical protein
MILIDGHLEFKFDIKKKHIIMSIELKIEFEMMCDFEKEIKSKYA